jgi:hypothetical protein
MGILFGELTVHFTELDISLHEASPEHSQPVTATVRGPGASG